TADQKPHHVIHKLHVKMLIVDTEITKVAVKDHLLQLTNVLAVNQKAQYKRQ
ncbi:19987_t:CDS:1, partial [Racocetra persica]